MFRALSAVLILVVIALASALITMRLAIHGSEVRVPELAGLSLSDAAMMLHEHGLETGIDGRFYSTNQPAGHVLTQSPEPGTRVRKSWRVRLTISLGPQKVAIPKLQDMDESIASITLRRSSLQLGDVVSLPYAYATENTVIAQAPEAAAMDVEGPRVSLLIAQPDTGEPAAAVMPDFSGETFTAAAWAIVHAGYRLAPVATPAPAVAAVENDHPTVAALQIPQAAPGTVIGQSPAAGSRILAGATIQLKVQP